MAKKKINLAPQILDLVLYSGDGVNFRFTITDALNVAIPITGAMRSQIRATRDAPDPPLASFTVDLTDGADGIVVISLTGDDTASLTPTEEPFVGVWDLEWTPSGEQPVTMVQGKLECMPDVTR